MIKTVEGLQPINQTFSKEEVKDFRQHGSLSLLFGETIYNLPKQKPKLYKSKEEKTLAGYTTMRFDDLDLYVYIPDWWLFERLLK